MGFQVGYKEFLHGFQLGTFYLNEVTFQDADYRFRPTNLLIPEAGQFNVEFNFCRLRFILLSAVAGHSTIACIYFTVHIILG